MYDRFDLEQAIMQAWHTADDLKALYHTLGSRDIVDEDHLHNILLGLESIHEIRMQRLFDIFENLVRNGDIA